MLIAPCSADALAKITTGISDSLVYSVVRAWDTTGLVDRKKKRVLVAPAMNTAMWNHPVTEKGLAVLREWQEWVEVLSPIKKDLACGDVGDGAMREWREIVGVVEKRLGLDGRG